jgi:hypothetical protein
MRLFCVALVCITIFSGEGIAQNTDNPSVAVGQTSDTSAKPVTKPKKVWTNDDFDPSFPSPGEAAPLARRSSARRFSDAVIFLTPHGGDVVQPGDVLHIGISVARGKVNGPVVIVSPIGDSNEVRESPPYSFTMNVSRDDTVGAGSPLIGMHPITASGKLEGQYDLASIDVDVEEREMPTKLSIGGNMAGQYGPPEASFFEAGQQDSIRIFAKFPNGDEFDIINSTYLKLVSENPNVVNVGEAGRLTSIGPGKTTVTATYSFGGQTSQLSLPVSVSVPSVGLIPNPFSLDFGDQPVGRWSNPLQVVLTNRTDSTIKIYAPEIRQAAARASDDCTGSPLPPGGSCTMSVTFLADQPGRCQGVIYIPNSHSMQISLPVSGNGR